MFDAEEFLSKHAKPVNMNSLYEETQKRLEILQNQWDKMYKEEQDRINDMECPLCKSKDKNHIVKYVSNGVFGPGYHSKVTDDYYVCNSCGIHFSDLKARDLGKRPDCY